MPHNLVIVESPTKARTIGPYLGKDFQVEASFGHIRDLPKKGMSIDTEGTFEPTYEIPADKKKRVAELKKLAKAADEVWLGSDEDREGEAIAWHLCIVLGLDPKTTKRIVFHEITKPAIEKAIKNPRTVLESMFHAQQARRVLDRLVGYELSPVLWKKVRPGLSAGRVQSVAVRLIVEREREIGGFDANSSFKTIGSFVQDANTFYAEYTTRMQTDEEARQLLEKCNTTSFEINSIDTKPGKRTPSAPFTTSTLQQEASRKLGFGLRQTMSVAQKLYEQGDITYMRTDSVHLSDTALDSIKATVKKHYGDKYYQKRAFTTKSTSAQEAHEAIRPTDASKRTAGQDASGQKLYQLIWQRSVASQMADARIERTTVTVAGDTLPETFKATGEVVIFDGFLSVYQEGSDGEESNTLKRLPELHIGATTLKSAASTQVYDRARPRYTEASLVKKLEEMEIGRPATYAPTISTIIDRGYVEKGQAEAEPRPVKVVRLENNVITTSDEQESSGSTKGKLVPTAVGGVVTDFLTKHFPVIVDYDFTAESEKKFDQVEHKGLNWQTMIKEFYGPFHQTVVDSEKISRKEAINARNLGDDPKTGKPVYARIGRYGAMIQIGETESEDKPQFASLPQGKTLESVTLEDALELFSLPKKLGTTDDGEEITTNFGPFGPYVKYGKAYVSIKPETPFTVTLDHAKGLIAEHKEAQAKRVIAIWGSVQVLRGRFGPYITDGTKNAKIPKDVQPESLTKKAAEKLLSEAPKKAAKPKRGKKRPK